MTKKALVVLASARKKGNTELFVDRVFKQDEIDKLDLLDYHISPFNYSGTYPEDDEFQRVADHMLLHQIIVFATPVYWYAMSGQLKLLFDRFTDLVTVKKQTGRQLAGKSTFLMAVGADRELPPGFEVPFFLTSAYLSLSYGGCIYWSAEEVPLQDFPEDEIELFTSTVHKYCW